MKIKNKIKFFLNRYELLNEFCHDYMEYKKWNYNNPKVRTLAAYEAKLLRRTHTIEKGLSLPEVRPGFGLSRIYDLFDLLDEYISTGFPVNNIPFINAIAVLNCYVKSQKELGFRNLDLEKRLGNYQEYLPEVFEAGIVHSNLEEVNEKRNSHFPVFFESRHSIRQFSDRQVNIEDIKKSVQLALKAPTACNRQASRVYFYDDNEINKSLGKLIDGNNGFEHVIRNYLVITADISAFYDSFERNQLYVEAGIFTMALVQALHYYGIGSCILQNGEKHKKNKKIKTICTNIPESEKIVVFIAIGYYKEEFTYALSHRKLAENILKVNDER